MGAPAAIGIDDDLSPSKACITLRSADDELARRIDVQMRVVSEECDSGLAILQDDLLECCLDDILHDSFVHVFHARRSHLSASVALALLGTLSLQWLSMLGGDEDSVNLLRLYGAILLLQILNGDLGLAIGSQPPQLATLAHICQCLAQ